jgi:hypothetical protein
MNKCTVGKEYIKGKKKKPGAEHNSLLNVGKRAQNALNS